MVIKNHLLNVNTTEFNIFIIIIGNFKHSHKNLFRQNNLYREISFSLKHNYFYEIILGYSSSDYGVLKILSKLTYRKVIYFLDSWVKVQNNQPLLKIINISNKIICNDVLMKRQVQSIIKQNNKKIIVLYKFKTNKTKAKKNKLIFFLWPNFFKNKYKLKLFLKYLSKINEYKIYIKYHPSFTREDIENLNINSKLIDYSVIDSINTDLLNYSILVAHFSSTLIKYSSKNNVLINFTFYKDKNKYGWNDINIYNYYSIKCAKTLTDLYNLIKNEK